MNMKAIEVKNEHVYVVLTNWNGWRDAIECLESLFRLNYPSYTVVVSDNDSSDGSLEKIRGWARGEIVAETANPALARLTTPAIRKPVAFSEPQTSQSENGKVPLVLLQTGANLGFAGGSNTGIRYALKQDNCDFVWLLNNDMVMEPDALSQAVRRMQERPDAGICGSTVLYYYRPDVVQAFGGSIYNKWVARGGHIGKLAAATPFPDAQEVERKMGYVYGAAMLVRRSFLDQVGLMNEQYFAYFEELDWAARSKGRFTMAYAPLSIIYHKEGGALGSHQTTLSQSARAEFYLTRNRILFTRTHYPLAVPSVLAAVTLSAFHRLLHLHWKNLWALLRGAFQGTTVRIGDNDAKFAGLRHFSARSS
jgi:GT2 family glycosyltransferase